MFKADDYRLKIKALGATLEETAEALDIGGLRNLPRSKPSRKIPKFGRIWKDPKK